mgnify:CR=1 FL=1
MPLVDQCQGAMRIKAGELAKLKFDNTQVKNFGGVICNINIDTSDVNSAKKIKAIESALTKIHAKGYTLPASITFYLADGETVVPGFEKFGRSKAPTKAYSRDEKGNDAAIVFLGRNSTPQPPNPAMQDLNGIANKLGSLVPAGFTAMVAAHEIGHVLHEYHQPGVSFGDINLDSGQRETAKKHISAYASANKLEVVAEVFCAHIYDWKLTAEADKLYAACGGPPLK